MGIADGDTIRMLNEGRAEWVWLWGIEFPEKGQPFGNRARQFTGYLAFSKHVTVIVHDVDRYGRTAGEVILPDGRNLNQEVFRVSLASWYIGFAHRDRVLASLQTHTRVVGRQASGAAVGWPGTGIRRSGRD